jgi:catechol 2,3-dioxygenase-like lactoylglutathione lyase family enzyme
VTRPILGHTLLLVEDIDHALPFWTEGLGFRLKSQEAGYVELLDQQERVFGMVTPKTMSHFLGHRPKLEKPTLGVWQTSCFLSIEIADITSALNRLEVHNVVTLTPPALMPWGATVAFLQDPHSGFCFELCQK